MKKFTAEFIGTFFVVLVIGLTVLGGAGNMAPVAIGAVVMVMVFAGAHISGGHYNPAVTLAVLIRGRIKAAEAVPYMIFQIAGAAAAACVVCYFMGDAMPSSAPPPSEMMKALAGEFLGTFALVYVVLNVATARGNENNSFYGLAIGLTVTAMAFALGSFSGGAFNPAVAIGVSIMKLASWSNIWIYAVGCFGAAIAAALVFMFINPEDHKVPPISD